MSKRDIYIFTGVVLLGLFVASSNQTFQNILSLEESVLAVIAGCALGFIVFMSIKRGIAPTHLVPRFLSVVRLIGLCLIVLSSTMLLSLIFRSSEPVLYQLPVDVMIVGIAWFIVYCIPTWFAKPSFMLG